MEYVNLGNTGSVAHVSRDDELRRAARAGPGRSPEAEGGADRPSRGGGWHHVLPRPTSTTARQSEVVTGLACPGWLSREELVIATKVHGRTMPGRERPGDCHAST